jgi:cyanate permease
MQWFSQKEIPLVNGINLGAASVGNTIALFTTVLIANSFTWEKALSIYGAVTLFFTLAWLIFGRENRSPVTKINTENITLPIGISTALRKKTTLLLGLSMGGPNIIFMAISSWLPTYYNEVFGMPLSKASSITGLFTLFGIPACILGGLFPMWVGLRRPFLLIPGLLIGFAGLGSFLFNQPIVIYASVIIFGICIWIFRPSILTLCMELPGMSPSVAAVIIAAALAIGNLVGFTGPLIVGFLFDIYGSYLPGLIVCSILSFSLFICGLLLPETGPKAKQLS